MVSLDVSTTLSVTQSVAVLHTAMWRYRLLYRCTSILHHTTNCRFIIIIIIIIRRVHCMLESEKPCDAPMFSNFVKSVVDDGFYGLTIRPPTVCVRY